MTDFVISGAYVGEGASMSAFGALTQGLLTSAVAVSLTPAREDFLSSIVWLGLCSVTFFSTIMRVVCLIIKIFFDYWVKYEWNK